MWRIIFLFLLPTFIWGSTWIAIKMQLVGINPIVSVWVRFCIASLLAGAWALSQKNKLFTLTKSQHLQLLMMGIANYSINYILTYFSEEHLTSGLVAVIFSLMIYFNMAGLYVFYKQPVQKKTFLGALVGGIGIFLIFRHEFLSVEMSTPFLLGVFLAVTGTLSASSGNLISVSLHKQHVPVLTMNFWGMLYGCIFSFIACLITGAKFEMTSSITYWSSLFYLAIIGTVIAFGAYMTLIKEVGADRAAYTTIFTPVIALIISTFFEKYEWTLFNFVGVILTFIGQFIILQSRKKKSTQTSTVIGASS